MSPLGHLTLFEQDGAIISLDWGRVDGGEPSPLLEQARDQVLDYFDGARKDFTIPLQPHGTAFQQKVWQSMCAIPFGSTRTYGAVAAELGSSPRAVGTACGRNPLPILIPCHRVLGRNTLGGFSAPGGVETKVALLRFEGAAGLLI